MEITETARLRLQHAPLLREKLEQAAPEDRIEEPVLLLFHAAFTPPVYHTVGAPASSNYMTTALSFQHAKEIQEQQANNVSENYQALHASGVEVLNPNHHIPAALIRGTAQQILDVLSKDFVRRGFSQTEAEQELGKSVLEDRVTKMGDAELQQLLGIGGCEGRRI